MHKKLVFKQWKIAAAVLAILFFTLLVTGTAMAAARQAQTIQCKNSFVVQYKSGGKFQLNAKAKSSMRYKSGNTSVATVSSSGIVTIRGYGLTIITITAKNTTKYISAQKKVSVYVKPAAPVITSLSVNNKGEITLKWKKDPGVTGYVIQYSRTADFKNSKRKNIPNKNTISRTFSDTESDSIWYVRIQSYLKINGKNYFGPFSATKPRIDPNVQTQDMRVVPTSISMRVGETSQLTVTGAKTTVSYRSSDPSKVYVNSSGWIKAKKTGTVTITVKAKGTTKYKPREVKVQITVNNKALSESQLRAKLASKGHVDLWCCTDYDGDGLEEAFAITAGARNIIRSVWFVDPYGKVTELLRSGSNAEDYLGTALISGYEPTTCSVDMGSKSYYFVNYNQSGTVWSDKALLFGVKNGAPYELSISRKISGFFMNDYGTIYTIRHYLTDHHVYMAVRLVYNSAAGQFVLGEDLGDLNT